MFSKPFAFICLALSVYIIVISSQTLMRINEVERDKEITAQALQKEAERSTQLQKIIAIQDTDDYLESLARKRLGLVKLGEVVYKIVMKE